jgi:serine protease Do
VVGSDISTDVAVIRIEPRPGEALPVAPLGDSETLRVGDWVLALGNPLGLTFTVTAGIVSAQGRTMPGPTREPTNLESFIQTDAVINPGNSGGPLVDLAGRVVGVNTAIFGSDRFVGYGFAVPIRLARRVADDLIAYGHLRRPQLGAEIRGVTAVDAEIYGLPEVRGALISALNPPGGPAATAGLRAGDVVLAIDGTDVRDDTHLLTTLAERRPGQAVTLQIRRAGQTQSVNVQLGEFARPPAARAAAPAPRDQPEQVLGFTVRDLSPADARRAEFTGQGGVIVAETPQFSAAVEAGIRPNTIILAINGQQVTSAAQVRQVAGGITPGSAVSLLIHRQDVGEMVVNYRTRQ